MFKVDKYSAVPNPGGKPRYMGLLHTALQGVCLKTYTHQLMIPDEGRGIATLHGAVTWRAPGAMPKREPIHTKT